MQDPYSILKWNSEELRNKRTGAHLPPTDTLSYANQTNFRLKRQDFLYWERVWSNTEQARREEATHQKFVSLIVSYVRKYVCMRGCVVCAIGNWIRHGERWINVQTRKCMKNRHRIDTHKSYKNKNGFFSWLSLFHYICKNFKKRWGTEEHKFFMETERETLTVNNSSWNFFIWEGMLATVSTNFSRTFP